MQAQQGSRGNSLKKISYAFMKNRKKKIYTISQVNYPRQGSAESYLCFYLAFWLKFSIFRLTRASGVGECSFVLSNLTEKEESEEQVELEADIQKPSTSLDKKASTYSSDSDNMNLNWKKRGGGEGWISP